MCMCLSVRKRSSIETELCDLQDELCFVQDLLDTGLRSLNEALALHLMEHVVQAVLLPALLDDTQRLTHNASPQQPSPTADGADRCARPGHDFTSGQRLRLGAHRRKGEAASAVTGKAETVRLGAACVHMWLCSPSSGGESRGAATSPTSADLCMFQQLALFLLAQVTSHAHSHRCLRQATCHHASPLKSEENRGASKRLCLACLCPARPFSE